MPTGLLVDFGLADDTTPCELRRRPCGRVHACHRLANRVDRANGGCGAPQQCQIDEPPDARFDLGPGIWMDSGRRGIGEVARVHCGVT